MAYTGKNLYDDLAVRVYQGGAGAFLNVNRAQYVVGFAVKEALEKRYNSIIKQQSTDEINQLVKVDKLFPAVNNKVQLKPLEIVNIQVGQSSISFLIKFNRIPNLNFAIYPGGAPIYLSGIDGTLDIAALNNSNLAAFPDTLNNDPYSILVQYPSTAGSYSKGGIAIPDIYGIGVEDSLWVYDYYHLLAVALTGYKKVNTAISSVDIIKQKIVLKSNNIRTGEKLLVSLPGTNISASIAYAKMIGTSICELYTTESLETKLSITGSYTGSGTIYRYMESYAEPLPSDTKIGAYGANEYFPLYQTAENELTIQPSDFIQSYYKLDYISSLSEIDVTNTIKDLTQVYNLTMLNDIIELAATKFFAITSSTEDVQITNAINQPNANRG